MNEQVPQALVAAVHHYLERIEHVLGLVKRQPNAQKLLDLQLAPDMFDTGFHLAIAIQFAARAICPAAAQEVPEIPDEYTIKGLGAFRHEIANAIRAISVSEMTLEVAHRAGEAELSQSPSDYIARFALPNLIFHFSMAYAALRQAGLKLGKSDFDGLHMY